MMAWFGAGNGIRTRDVQLGKLTLYQLSYARSPGRGLYHRASFPLKQAFRLDDDVREFWHAVC